MPVIDWGSIPRDVLNSVSERCSSTSVAALRGVSRHWNRTSSSAKRCRCNASVTQRTAVFELPPIRDFRNLKIVELSGVQVLGRQLEALLDSKVLKALAVKECLIDELAVDSVFAARSLDHLSLASSRVIVHETSLAGLEGACSSRNPCVTSINHDADGDVVMWDQAGSECTTNQHPESTLRSLDISGVQGLSDDRAASALSACRQLVALRTAVSPAQPATLLALAHLPSLAHLEISTATIQTPIPQLCDIPEALAAICNAAAERAAPLGALHTPLPTNEALTSLQAEAPWWSSPAHTSSNTHPSPASASLYASLQPQSPFHLVVDFPIVTSHPRSWLTEAFASIHFRALTLRQPQQPESCSDVLLNAAHGIPCSHSVPALPGPATLAAQATPDTARALHALLPDLLLGNASLLHFQILGVEMTEAIIRHMRMVHMPLQSLCLHNRDPDATANALPTSLRPHRTRLEDGEDQEHTTVKMDKAAASTLTAAEMRARMAARWRRPASATLRQLIDTQASERLHRLELIDLPGVNDTVLRRIRSQATALQHLTVGGTCKVTLEGIAELRWMKLASLHLCNLRDEGIATRGVQMLACGVSGLVSSLTDLSFEGFKMRLPAFASLQLFTKLQTLSLDGSMIGQPPESGPLQMELLVSDQGAQVLDAARKLLQNSTLSRISACGTGLGEVLGHARGQLQASCHIETVTF